MTKITLSLSVRGWMEVPAAAAGCYGLMNLTPGTHSFYSYFLLPTSHDHALASIYAHLRLLKPAIVAMHVD